MNEKTHTSVTVNPERIRAIGSALLMIQEGAKASGATELEFAVALGVFFTTAAAGLGMHPEDLISTTADFVEQDLGEKPKRRSSSCSKS